MHHPPGGKKDLGTQNPLPLPPAPPPSVAEGQGYSHPASGLVIRRASSTMGGIAVVTICRKANNGQENATSCANNWDYNCDGRAGDDDPGCAMYR